MIYIETGDVRLEEVRVFDLEGREVQFHSGSTLRSIPLLDLATGAYLIRIYTMEGMGTRRSIKI